ncbi:MAG: glycosyltransferase family 39 protein [Myxococcaceae bacterium]
MSEPANASQPAPVSEPAPLDKLDRRWAWGLFLAGFFLLLLTERNVGFGRDESVYFHAAESHARWFQVLFSSPSQAVTDPVITQHFDFNHEHPALMKNLFGLSFVLFHEKLGLLRPAAAFRVPAFAFAAWMLPLIFLLSRRMWGRAASVFAAVSFFLVPRQFFHSHLACFDVPIATAWVFTVYCFVQALERPRWWIYTGLAFGLALGAKHNAYFIVVTLIPFILYRGWQVTKGAGEARWLFFAINGTFVFGAVLYVLMVAAMGGEKVLATFTFQSPQLGLYLVTCGVGGWLTWRLSKVNVDAFRTIAPLVAMAVLGPAVFYAHWPYLWHHPVDRTAWYLNFHLTHNHYAWFYLGELLRGPPFPLSYVVVKTALTVPTAIFAAMSAGFVWVCARALKRTLTGFEFIVLANAVMSIALISHPTVPHFGGVKHWFPSMPFLAVLAAGSLERGSKALSEWLSPKWKAATERNLVVALSVLLGVSGLIATARVYEFGTSAYSELAGGLPGAASLGMQRQYWANNLSGVLPWLNANTRPGDRVYFHENHGGQIRDLQRNGMLRADVVPVGGPDQADLVIYQYHQEFRDAEFMTWQAMGTARPVYGLYLDETPQIIVYRRLR